jgi:hypothetical protein
MSIKIQFNNLQIIINPYYNQYKTYHIHINHLQNINLTRIISIKNIKT